MEEKIKEVFNLERIQEIAEKNIDHTEWIEEECGERRKILVIETLFSGEHGVYIPGMVLELFDEADGYDIEDPYNLKKNETIYDALTCLEDEVNNCLNRLLPSKGRYYVGYHEYDGSYCLFYEEYEGGRRMNSKEKTMREEARTAIIEALRDGYNGYYCDLHDEVFNTSYYIVGTHEAKEALKEYDVFEAIEKIQTYEKDNFGEVYTDLSDPEKLINMLFYIIGEEVLFEMMEGVDEFHDNWNYQADEETNTEILKALGE